VHPCQDPDPWAKADSSHTTDKCSKVEEDITNTLTDKVDTNKTEIDTITKTKETTSTNREINNQITRPNNKEALKPLPLLKVNP
jgi:hypothetical protein